MAAASAWRPQASPPASRAPLLLGRGLATLVYGVSPNDPLTLGLAVALLAVISLQAAWLPARRASRIDPSAALRGQ